jgi:glucose/arabinose dehydrogenase
VTAVWSVGHHDPRGLAWRGDTLWTVERDETGDEINAVRRGANYGWPLVRGAGSHPLVTRPSFVLPAGTDVTGLTALPPASPWTDSLIVSARSTQGLLRLQLDAGRRQQAISPLVTHEIGAVGQVAAAPDGSLWLITADDSTSGISRLLIRLSP